MKVYSMYECTLKTKFGYILGATIISVILQGSVYAKEKSVYVEQVLCSSEPYGLKLPASLKQVMQLGPILKQRVDQVEQWDGYTSTRKYVFFSGIVLGLVTFSNSPERYMLSFAEVSHARWNHLLPFKIGQSPALVRKQLGAVAVTDTDLSSSYEGDTDSISFQTSGNRLLKVTYDCYTG